MASRFRSLLSMLRKVSSAILKDWLRFRRQAKRCDMLSSLFHVVPSAPLPVMRRICSPLTPLWAAVRPPPPSFRCFTISLSMPVIGAFSNYHVGLTSNSILLIFLFIISHPTAAPRCRTRQG